MQITENESCAVPIFKHSYWLERWNVAPLQKCVSLDAQRNPFVPWSFIFLCLGTLCRCMVALRLRKLIFWRCPCSYIICWQSIQCVADGLVVTADTLLFFYSKVHLKSASPSIFAVKHVFGDVVKYFVRKNDSSHIGTLSETLLELKDLLNCYKIKESFLDRYSQTCSVSRLFLCAWLPLLYMLPPFRYNRENYCETKGSCCQARQETLHWQYGEPLSWVMRTWL